MRRYQYLPKGSEFEPDAKAGMVGFMQPLVHGGFVPDVCKANEERFVDKRMKDIVSKELPLDNFMLKCMEEFAAFVVPDNLKHSLTPEEVEVVFDRQNKPSQRAILNRADNESSTGVTPQFGKREAYQSVNDPRGISTMCGPDKRDFSKFIYAFTDRIMKPLSWYAFSKTPVEVAERVAAVAEAAKERVANTDFSRMDGRHSNVLAFLERMIYCRGMRSRRHPWRWRRE